MGDKKPFYHWTDVFADKIIRIKGNKDKYILQSGITPSGMIHAGNFREVITADLVRRALERRGKKVAFLYVWDDYDVLRKVPVNLPKQEMIAENLRKPVFKVPDPFGCHESYARHFESIFENESTAVGIVADFVYSHKHYLACEFADEIKIALENTSLIKELLNKYRKEDLGEDWLPIFVFCEKCNRDDVEKISWTQGYEVTYTCKCGHQETIDYRKKGIVTLRWRVDWPMRWHRNKVDFETAGKDHFAAGGSVTTGILIQEQVYKSEPPVGIKTNDFYEWIGIKGGGEFSSSKGNVTTVTDLLDIYEPEIVRYIFAGTRPNKAFSISFDVDVLALYEEFDKTERIYFGLDKVNEKKAEKHKVAYELSHLGEIPKTIPYQPSFRHLTMLLQIHDFDIDKVIGYFEKELKNEYDRKRLRVRAECAKNWIQKYAPEEFTFTLQETCQVTLVEQEKKILWELADKLEEKEWTDKQLHEEIYVLCKNHDFPTGDFFKLAYRVLINKDKGPRLASFILEIGRKRVAGLLRNVDASKKTQDQSGETSFEYKPIDGVFEISSDVVEKFPGLKVGIAIIKGVDVKKSIPKLDKLKKGVVDNLIEEFKEKDLKDVRALEEYKKLYRATGVDPTKQKPSPLALLQRVKAGKELYTVNTLVDIYNLAVMKTQVSMGAFNLESLKFPTYLRHAQEGEEYTPLQATSPDKIKQGELVYVDDAGLIFCRDLNYRDSEFTKIDENTKDVILYVDGTRVTSQEELKNAMDLTLKWITQYCGGKVEKVAYTFSSSAPVQKNISVTIINTGAGLSKLEEMNTIAQLNASFGKQESGEYESFIKKAESKEQLDELANVADSQGLGIIRVDGGILVYGQKALVNESTKKFWLYK